MPLLPLHPPLTYLWAPHVSIFFIFPFFPSRCRRPPPLGPSAHPSALCACPGRIVGGGEDGGRRSGAGAGESARLAREVALQRRRSVRAPSAAQASPEAAPFGVHARAPPRRSGSAPELGVLHRQRPSAPPRRARPCGAPPPKSARARRRRGPALAGAAAPRSPALRTRPLLPPALAPAASRGGRVRRASRGGRRRRGGARGGGRREQARGGRTHRRWGG